MIKELILAIILGALLGLGIMGGYLTANKKIIFKKPSATEISPTPEINQEITPTPTVGSNDQLTIDSPENNSIVSVSKINITGITTPNSIIIITTSSDSFNDKSDENGKFNIPIELESGANLVKVTTIDSNDNQTDITLTITYSTAEI